MWVTDGTPAKIVLETLHLPHSIEPPPNGSVLNVVTFPPDAAWKGKINASDVEAFFKSMGSPKASTLSPQAPHPYMQKTRTLEFGIVLEGELVLVLDTQEVVGQERRLRRAARHQPRVEQSDRQAGGDRDRDA